MDRLRITEIFHSIQGESTHAGRRCHFVRLTGCNLRCSWCDSVYTFTGGAWQTFAEIFAVLEANGPCNLLEVTGGEPLLQPAVNRFMAEALERGYEVLLETSGSLDISPVPLEVRRILDIKPPSSGEVAKNLWSNLALLQPWDEVKALISDRTDYAWAKEVVLRHRLAERVTVLFSPVFDAISYETLATWILEDKLDVRMQLQMHKHIWDPARVGV